MHNMVTVVAVAECRIAGRQLVPGAIAIVSEADAARLVAEGVVLRHDQSGPIRLDRMVHTEALRHEEDLP